MSKTVFDTFDTLRKVLLSWGWWHSIDLIEIYLMPLSALNKSVPDRFDGTFTGTPAPMGAI